MVFRVVGPGEKFANTRRSWREAQANRLYRTQLWIMGRHAIIRRRSPPRGLFAPLKIHVEALTGAV